MEAERSKNLQDWARVVVTLFKDMVDDNDLMIRPANVPFDGTDPGTVVTFVHRETAGRVSIIEEIFSSCDYDIFYSLVRAYQRRVNTHVITSDVCSMFVYNKANLKGVASKTYVASVA